MCRIYFLQSVVVLLAAAASSVFSCINPCGWEGGHQGYCLNLKGEDLQRGQVPHVYPLHDSTTLSAAKCLEWCKSVPGANACEQTHVDHRLGYNEGCYVHIANSDPRGRAVTGNGGGEHYCWTFETVAPTPATHFIRHIHKQCTARQIQYGEDPDDPIFQSATLELTLEGCKGRCIGARDLSGRPCVGVEWSDQGLILSSMERRKCDLLWGCDNTMGWSGGSAFVRNYQFNPTQSPSAAPSSMSPTVHLPVISSISDSVSASSLTRRSPSTTSSTSPSTVTEADAMPITKSTLDSPTVDANMLVMSITLVAVCIIFVVGCIVVYSKRREKLTMTESFSNDEDSNANKLPPNDPVQSNPADLRLPNAGSGRRAWVETWEQVNEVLGTKYNLQCVDLGGGGDCQFRALEHQLFGTQDQQHFAMRGIIVNELKIHQQWYAEFCGGNWDEYTDNMAKRGTWGDDITLQAAANHYNMEIFVVRATGPTTTIPPRATISGNTRCWLAFCSNHYRSTMPISPSGPRIDGNVRTDFDDERGMIYAESLRNEHVNGSNYAESSLGSEDTWSATNVSSSEC